MAVPQVEVDLDPARRGALGIHVVLVGGTGMSAYAIALAQLGHRVSGSHDGPGAEVTARLRAAGVVVHTEYDAANLPPGTDLVAASTAIAPDHVELAAARAAGIPVLTRADLLAGLCALRPALAVAGTHGKTSTTTMAALALEGAGLRPSFVIGATVPALDGGARWDPGGRLFVVEADESDATFLRLPRAAAVVTNLEPDHLATYGGDVRNLVGAFERFVDETPGPVLLCADDPGAAALASAGGDLVRTYGTDPGADYVTVVERADGASLELAVLHGGERWPARLHVPGVHNARNATAALALAVLHGADPAAAGPALERFAVHRRFERRGTAGGVTFVDSYDHLPGEVRAVLQAARTGAWERIVCVFQPHRYSRTEEVHAEFAGAFDDADVLVVGGIFAAGEAPRPGVTGRLVADASGHRALTYVEDRSELAAAVRDVLRPGDLCLTLGAGDITRLPDELGARL